MLLLSATTEGDLFNVALKVIWNVSNLETTEQSSRIDFGSSDWSSWHDLRMKAHSGELTADEESTYRILLNRYLAIDAEAAALQERRFAEIRSQNEVSARLISKIGEVLRRPS